MRRVEVAEKQVGIGDGGRLAPLVVAHRARRGAGALGPHLQRAGRVNPHQRAAARAHLGEIDRRHLEVIARAGEQARADHDARAHRVFLRARDFAVLDHRRLRGGAAHVEGDDLRQALRPRERLRADHAARRPRLDDVDRPLHRRRVGGEAAVRLHQQQPRAHAGLIEPLAQRPQIARDDRRDVRVDHRGRGALVFLDLRQHLARDGAGQRRRLSPDELLDGELMRRVGVRVQQADRDRLDLFREQLVDYTLGIARIERALHLARRVDALVEHLAQIALDQRRRLGPADVVHARHAQRADLEHVAEAPRGDQPGSGALVLEDRVRGDGRAVAQLLDRLRREPHLAQHFRQAFDDRLRVVLDARGDLLGVDRAVGAEQHDVGEGAADVDTDAITPHRNQGQTTFSVLPAAAKTWSVPVFGSGSCHCTFGTSRQPRAARISARRLALAALSTFPPAMITP